MTKSELINFMKTDPVFKVADKQVVGTLYESPFDNVVIDQEAGTITLTLHGEDFTLAFDDTDLAALFSENPYLRPIINAKRVIISAGFRDIETQAPVVANDTDITANAIIPFPEPDDDGDDGGDDGDGGIS